MDARRMVSMVARRQNNEENIRFEGTEADRAVGVLDERVELLFTFLRAGWEGDGGNGAETAKRQWRDDGSSGRRNGRGGNGDGGGRNGGRGGGSRCCSLVMVMVMVEEEVLAMAVEGAMAFPAAPAEGGEGEGEEEGQHVTEGVVPEL